MNWEEYSKEKRGKHSIMPQLFDRDLRPIPPYLSSASQNATRAAQKWHFVPRCAVLLLKRRSCCTRAALADTHKAHMQLLDALVPPAQPQHNAAHAPCVTLWDVCSAKHSIHCPCEHRCLSCADVFIHSHKQPSLHGQLGKEEIPGTEMTARAPCQYSEPDFPLFCLQVTFLFACLKIEIVKEGGWRHGRKHCAMKHNILGVKWNISVVPLLFGFPWQKKKKKRSKLKAASFPFSVNTFPFVIQQISAFPTPIP